MATGKVDVSRRCNYYSPSGRARDRRQHEVSQRNRHYIPSNAIEHQKFPEGREQLHHEKKRKFSPIIWDREDNQAKKTPRYGEEEAKVVPEKRVVPASIISAIVKSQSEPSSDVSDGCFSKSPASKQLGPGSKLLVMSPQKHDQKEDVEHSVVEDGELVQERNLLMSRWASEDESPWDKSVPDEDEMFELKDGSGTSTESGEFRIGRPDHWPGSSGEFDGSCESQKVAKHAGLTECPATYDDSGDYLNQSDSRSDEESSEIEESWSSSQGRVSMLNSCRSVFEFERLNRISEGTYGVVFRAKEKKTGEIVALKKVKMSTAYPELGFPLSALREINILLSINHPSIVTVKEVVMDDHDNVFMVMEYMEHDLKGLVEMRKRPFSTSEIKCLMLQLLDGVKYLHDNWVLHRDLKTSNLLVNNKGELKICDLGLSRHYGSPLKPCTPVVVTMWYRAPELLLDAKEYSTAIDMWSVGCIMAELLANEPLFKGSNEPNQLDKIFRTLGTPNEKIWPGFSKLPGTAKAKFVKHPYNNLRKKFPATSFTGSTVLSESGFDLLNQLLTYDPEKRITADEALNHAWFQEVPLPTCKELMPTFPPRHAAAGL
ncbi:cyclin-dependent kinase 10-like [Punica granatum]|uniref:cyclin-dependent kinase n=2 Tax=Punica granatum TaxID=22663 RepID=A0A6P8BR72_PUNGR|nr:cyclin-dependent kinase 10-like [Punica granatum]